MSVAVSVSAIDSRKQELRLLVSDKVAALNTARRADLGKQLLKTITRQFASCAGLKIAIYWSLSSELATQGIADFWHEQGAELYLPAVISDGSMELRIWRGEALSEDLQGIPSPASGAATATPEQLDLMLLPLRGFDLLGGRLGTGGGYYDRFLSGSDYPPLLGLAFDEQLLDEVPVTEADVWLDGVLTPSQMHLFNNRLGSIIQANNPSK